MIGRIFVDQVIGQIRYALFWVGTDDTATADNEKDWLEVQTLGFDFACKQAPAFFTQVGHLRAGWFLRHRKQQCANWQYMNGSFSSL